MDINTKSLEDYIHAVDQFVYKTASTGEDISFADIVHKLDISPITVLRHGDLKSYILNKVHVCRKEKQKRLAKLESKIDRAIDRLINVGESMTFMSIIHKAKLSTSDIYAFPSLKDKITCAIKDAQSPK